MSIGSETRIEDIRPGKFQAFGNSVKKTISTVFLRPAHHLFYTTLAGVVVLHFMERTVRWEIYVTLALLLLGKFWQSLQILSMKKDE